MERLHRPVLLSEVIDNINIISEGVYADLTFGEGGHSDAILDRGIQTLVGNDRDASTLARYRLQGKYHLDPRLVLTQGTFSTFLQRSPIKQFDGILVDLGVSTRQLLEANRGFSLKEPGPLDMRMNQDEGASLFEILESISTEDLADALYANADLVESRRLARKIKAKLDAGELKTTLDLAAIAGPKRPGKSHPATALFTALRMLVNQEKEEVVGTFHSLIEALKPGGRLVVITFHSTEDRVVKKIFNAAAGRCVCDEPICRCSKVAKVRLVTRKPLEASEQELVENPRARSAKLRCVESLVPAL